ncbi:MAG: class I SAM-dependent methyltransferase, partial [Planctomycetaceae bacterium]|nr:class I SAM-dependent methyltransferase [Planctomycetaceae bacterium]
MGAKPNPFTDSQLAGRYEDWYAGLGSRADGLEKRLLGKLLTSFPSAREILEVGCGTGHFCRWLKEAGYTVVGLDSSPAMLDEARRRDAAPYIEGDAHQLPYA